VTRRGRPAGEIRSAVLSALPARSAWRSDEMAHALQVPAPRVRYTLSRLADAGAVRVVGEVARDGGGRRAALYALAESAGLVLLGADDD
jgi:predicted ArsR family transcriptional regulator